MRRRAFLGTIAGGGAVAIAGCLGPDRELAPPTVNDPGFEDEWREIDRSRGVAFDRSFGPVGVRATEASIVYEYRPLREEIAEHLDDADVPTSVLGTTRVDISPSIDALPMGIGRVRLMSRIDRRGREEFERQLGRNGIEDVERLGEESFQSDAGHEGTLTHYRGSVPVPEVEFPIGDQRVSLDIGSLDVEARFASWHDGTDVLFAGCAFPADSLTDVIEGATPGFVTIDLDFDIGYDPEDFEATVTALMRSVE